METLPKEFEVEIKNKETGEINKVVFSPHTPKEGRGKDKMKIFPKSLATMTVHDAIKLYGEKIITSALITKVLKPAFTAFTDVALSREKRDEKGEVVRDKDGNPVIEVETDPARIISTFSELASVFSRRGETARALKLRLNEIKAEQLELSDAFAKVMDAALTPEELKAELEKIKVQMDDLRAERAEVLKALEEKGPDKKDEEEEEEEAEEAAAS